MPKQIQNPSTTKKPQPYQDKRHWCPASKMRKCPPEKQIPIKDKRQLTIHAKYQMQQDEPQTTFRIPKVVYNPVVYEFIEPMTQWLQDEYDRNQPGLNRPTYQAHSRQESEPQPSQHSQKTINATTAKPLSSRKVGKKTARQPYHKRITSKQPQDDLNSTREIDNVSELQSTHTQSTKNLKIFNNVYKD